VHPNSPLSMTKGKGERQSAIREGGLGPEMKNYGTGVKLGGGRSKRNGVGMEG